MELSKELSKKPIILTEDISEPIYVICNTILSSRMAYL